MVVDDISEELETITANSVSSSYATAIYSLCASSFQYAKGVYYYSKIGDLMLRLK